MPYIDFMHLKELTPQAFKLYICFLHLSETRETNTFTLPLSDLGYISGLQTSSSYWASPHGNDGQLRRALAELIKNGLVQKQGQRGRSPNTYTLLHPNDDYTQN